MYWCQIDLVLNTKEKLTLLFFTDECVVFSSVSVIDEIDVKLHERVK